MRYQHTQALYLWIKPDDTHGNNSNKTCIRASVGYFEAFASCPPGQAPDHAWYRLWFIFAVRTNSGGTCCARINRAVWQKQLLKTMGKSYNIMIVPMSTLKLNTTSMENTTKRLKISRRPSNFCKRVLDYKKHPSLLVSKGLRQPNGHYEVHYRLGLYKRPGLHYRLGLYKRPGLPWVQSEN